MAALREVHRDSVLSAEKSEQTSSHFSDQRRPHVGVIYLVAWDLDTTQRMKFYRGYNRLVGGKWRKEGTLSVREFSDKALAEKVHALASKYGRSKIWEAREVVA